MPTYEYRCKDCAHTLDAYQAFTDDALTECPQCGGALKKLFGNVGISFRGSGFYKTDSRPASGSSDSDKSSSDKGSSPDAGDRPSGSSSDGPAKGTDSSKGASDAPSSKGSGADGASKATKPASPTSAKPSPASSST